MVEQVILTYCGYLGILMTVRPIASSRRRRTAWLLVTMAGAVTMSLMAPPGPVALVLRDWLPAVCILLGYWASGGFFVAPMGEWERRLGEIDWRLARYIPRVAAVGPVLELAYLSVYLVIPAGFAAVYWHSRSMSVDQYWTVVVASEFGCYAMLPWLQTRPPRALAPHAPGPAAPWLRRLNLTVLAHGSIQANTFPSAHAAGAVATALAVMALRPAVGTLFLLWAVLIAAGSVAGRYHYAADAVLGAAWALVVWWAVGR